VEAHKDVVRGVLKPRVGLVQLTSGLGSQLTELIPVFDMGKSPKDKIRAHFILLLDRNLCLFGLGKAISEVRQLPYFGLLLSASLDARGGSHGQHFLRYKRKNPVDLTVFCAIQIYCDRY
jgi:hypothetical protein